MEISLPVTLAVLGGALLHAGWNALIKASADKRLDTVAVSAGAGLIALAVQIVLGGWTSSNYAKCLGATGGRTRWFGRRKNR